MSDMSDKYLLSDLGVEINEIPYNLLHFLKIGLLKNDLNSPYLEKAIFIYDAPELTALSPTAIVTDSLVLLNNKFLSNTSENYLEKNRLNFQALLDNSHDIIKDNIFINFLEEKGFSSYTVERVKQLSENPHQSEYLPLTKEDKIFVQQFNEVQFPNFIKTYKGLLKKNNNDAQEYTINFAEKLAEDLKHAEPIKLYLITENFNPGLIFNKFGFDVDKDFTLNMAHSFHENANLTGETHDFLIAAIAQSQYLTSERQAVKSLSKKR